MSKLRWSFMAALVGCLLPLLAAFTSSLIASLRGCQLDEGGIHPCLVAGVDIGNALNTMFVMHWFALTTLPLAALLIVVWMLAELVALVRRKWAGGTRT